MTWESQRKYFNPRSHEGSDMIVCCCPSSREVFQSSLPRGERRVRVTYCTSCGNISILAPTRGATNSEAGNNRGIRFQSSLPRGERRDSVFMMVIPVIFQSSLPRGERQQFSPKSSLFSQQKLSKIFNLNNKLF